MPREHPKKGLLSAQSHQPNPRVVDEKHYVSCKKRFASRVSTWIKEWFTDWWGLEIVSWIFALLSVAAILITLKIHNGKPLPEWPFDITLNALISVFATTGEMAMMKPVAECLSQLKWLWFTRKKPLTEFSAFDEASRGSLGSFRLFILCRGLHLASLGATISIIALAFGPFTQQVLSYPSKRIVDGPAEAPQSANYTGGAELLENSVDQYMYGAVFSGLTATNANLSTVATSCPTGNCTFPVYPSLGICASVIDVSKYLVEIPSCENCFNYTLPGIGDDNITYAGLGSGLGYLQANLSNGIIGHLTFPGITLVDFFLFNQPFSDENGNPQVPTNSPLVLECRLEFCVHTYETTVTSAITNTILRSTERFEDNAMSNNISLKVNGVSFNVDGSTVTTIWESLAGSFTGKCTYSTKGEPSSTCISDSSGTGTPLDAGFFSISSAGSPSLASLVQAINTSDPISAMHYVMNNLSITMTNALRQGMGGDVSMAQVKGTAYSTKVYVQAEYLWLTLPIGLVFLTLIFLMATISKSRNAKTGIWKSSSLAALQGLNPQLHAQLGALHTIDEIEEIAKGLEVKIEMGEEGVWSLARCE